MESDCYRICALLKDFWAIIQSETIVIKTEGIFLL